MYFLELLIEIFYWRRGCSGCCCCSCCSSRRSLCSHNRHSSSMDHAQALISDSVRTVDDRFKRSVFRLRAEGRPSSARLVLAKELSVALALVAEFVAFVLHTFSCIDSARSIAHANARIRVQITCTESFDMNQDQVRRCKAKRVKTSVILNPNTIVNLFFERKRIAIANRNHVPV